VIVVDELKIWTKVWWHGVVSAELTNGLTDWFIEQGKMSLRQVAKVCGRLSSAHCTPVYPPRALCVYY